MAVRAVEAGAEVTAGEGRAVSTGAELGDDVEVQFADGAAAQAAAFAREGVLECTFHHPPGDMPGEVVLGFSIGDLIHAWDLARGDRWGRDSARRAGQYR